MVVLWCLRKTIAKTILISGPVQGKFFFSAHSFGYFFERRNLNSPRISRDRTRWSAHHQFHCCLVLANRIMARGAKKLQTRSSYEVMKLCTGSVKDSNGRYWVSMRRYQVVIDVTGSVEGIYAFIYWKKWRSGQVLPMPHRLTHRLWMKCYLAT